MHINALNKTFHHQGASGNSLTVNVFNDAKLFVAQCLRFPINTQIMYASTNTIPKVLETLP